MAFPKTNLNKNLAILIFGILLIFSVWLMFSTFGYDPRTNTILIAPKLWSDFGAHIPLIRSFSLGANLDRLIHFSPVISPLFPGEPIRYHFLFYAIVGILEKLGLRLDFALNLPSTVGFFGLLVMIYLIAKVLFQSRKAAFLSILLFLFNGTLAFIYFFRLHPQSLNSVTDIVRNSGFPAFGPWDGKLVSAFWNLNIYTNQRHLAFSYALGLLVIYLLLIHKLNPTFRKNIFTGILIGVIFGILVFMNLAAAAATGLFVVWFFILKKNVRLPLLISGLILIPVYFSWKYLTLPSGSITFNPAYLVAKPLSLGGILTYWIYNLGLYLVLIPCGLILSPKKTRHLLIIPLIILFVLPNLFQFSPDMINNHKFFNFFLIFGSMLASFVILRIFWLAKEAKRGIRVILSLIAVIFIILLTFSGVIDLFPIINDGRGRLTDIGANPDAQFFLNQTKTDSVVLNSTWFYHPASMSGRAIFNGYSYFAWSYGYNQTKREAIAVQIYRSTDLSSACSLLLANQINYVELSRQPESFIEPNPDLWINLPFVYENPESGLKIYNVKEICKL